MQPYQKAIIVISLLAFISFILRKLHNRSEHKRFIDNANIHSKKQKEYLRGEFDYRGRKVKSECDNEYVRWFQEDEATKN